MAGEPNLGAKVRALRRREGLTQARMAERLGISPSYLNLIEHGKRPLTAALLLKLATSFQIDLAAFSGDDDAALASDLMEVFGDPIFESHDLTNTDVHELARNNPAVARAVLQLYERYQGARRSAETLAAQVVGDDAPMVGRALPSEEVTALISRSRNHFATIEEAAERLWRDAGLDPHDVFHGLVRYLEVDLKVRVQVVGSGGGAMRRYDPASRRLTLSEVLPPRSRNFQLAHQIGLLVLDAVLEPILADPTITTASSRKLTRMVLASYFAGAVLMPYQRFHASAVELRYDIELLGHRFRTSFEQVCHRLTTLQRPGHEGIPFHFVKIDTAGNISKRFSASGIRFARFGGACPRWNVSHAFMNPGIRTQVSTTPDGKTYFCVARKLIRRLGGFGAPETVHAIGLGCSLEHAAQLVYADGIDLGTIVEAAVPIGVTCRLCERIDCDQRAFPSVQQPLKLDENVRGVGFYTTVDG
jgi:predicted transcriptional regulator/DNA-binding XRE family transcriptional regulator